MSDLEQRFIAVTADFQSPIPLKLLKQLGQKKCLQQLFHKLSDHALTRAAEIFHLNGAIAEWLLFQPGLLTTLDANTPTEDELCQLIQEIRDQGQSWPALRRMRRRLTFRIAAAEITRGQKEQPEIDSRHASSLLSRMSAEILKTGLQWLGLTRDFAVIALGKLGGWELNYSSDIDLLYLSREKNPDFELKARMLTRELEETLAPGRLFRVDLRLRPYGRSGALVPSVGAALSYYRKRGRSWERQAFIRACHLAGDDKLGAYFLEQIGAFIWDSQVDQASIRSLLELRKRTVKQVKNPDRHLKQGPGGIREIEFAVQFLQMLHGRHCKALHVSETCDAIAALAKAQIIWPKEATSLHESYVFQRSLEHLLQLRHDREQEIVPPPGPQCLGLAYPFGLSPKPFEDAFQQHRAAAADFLATILQLPFAQSTPSADPVSLTDVILNDQENSQVGAALLAKRGFQNGLKAFQNLISLGKEPSPFLAPSGRACILLAGLAPKLIDSIAKSCDPDRTLKNLSLAVSTIGARATFLQLLLQGDDVLRIFIRLAETGDFLIRTLARQPGVLNEVIDRLQTNHRISAETTKLARDRALEKSNPIAALSTLKAINTLHVGIHDIAGRYNVQNTGRDLSFVAEAVLSGLLELGYQSLLKRHGGRPVDASGEDVAFAVLAVGKLGGAEITYGSDYDLIFIHDGAGTTPDQTSSNRYFHHLVQEFIKSGATRTGERMLAPIDPRLRPAGSKSLLSCSLAVALDYYSGRATGDKAANWERLALTKARAIAGDIEFAQSVSAQLLSACEHGCDEQLWTDVVTMRRRQQQQAGVGNLKVGAGGLADIEFVTSALSLRYRAMYPELHEPNTACLINVLGQTGLITDRQTQSLLTGYQFLRTVHSRLRVVGGQPAVDLPKDERLLRSLALRLGYVDSAKKAELNFAEEIRFQRDDVKKTCWNIIEHNKQSSHKTL
jgi:[glutamine synthetase] adenylyltransferase / [glutamine synthetase]-adenylyl-L-tyrosine phosphorylase